MLKYYIGTAPFCDPQPEQCEKTPGFIATGKDKCGDGACCWTGQKIKCEFSKEAWKETPTYHELVTEDPNLKEYIPQFTWFGNAPFCGATPCDVFAADMLPIKNDKCGDGSCCAWGEKWLGVRPILKSHREVVNQGRKECMEFKKLQEQTLQAGLSFGGNVAKALASAAAARKVNIS